MAEQERERRPEKAPKWQAATGRSTGAVVTMVCLTCGTELFFDEAPQDALTCPTCAGTVFRRFDTPSKSDEAAAAAAEEQARSIAYGDASPQSSPDEVRDLHA